MTNDTSYPCDGKQDPKHVQSCVDYVKRGPGTSFVRPDFVTIVDPQVFEDLVNEFRMDSVAQWDPNGLSKLNPMMAAKHLTYHGTRLWSDVQNNGFVTLNSSKQRPDDPTAWEKLFSNHLHLHLGIEKGNVWTHVVAYKLQKNGTLFWAQDHQTYGPEHDLRETRVLSIHIVL